MFYWSFCFVHYSLSPCVVLEFRSKSLDDVDSVFETGWNFGSVVTFLLCVLIKHDFLESFQHTLFTLYDASFFFVTLLLLLFCVNVASLLLMFCGFTFAGMTYVYTVKTTEPFVMCLFSIEGMQKYFGQRLTSQEQMRSFFFFCRHP